MFIGFDAPNKLVLTVGPIIATFLEDCCSETLKKRLLVNSSVTVWEKFAFHWKYFATTMFVFAVVGVMSGIIANNDWRISLLAGYAGTDFLENLYRLRFAQFFKV